jgi:RHH-type rel operon transcriptional repressor/antitoxin RelB
MTPDGADDRLEITLDARQSARLDALADALSRARGELIGEAIDAFLAQQEQELRAIGEGLADAQAGRFASDAEVDAAFARGR